MSGPATCAQEQGPKGRNTGPPGRFLGRRYVRAVGAVCLAAFVLAVVAVGSRRWWYPLVRPGGTAWREEPSQRDARGAMVKNQIESRGVSDPKVLAAMQKVPRHLFVPADQVAHAYDDTALPIGLGQTISQPYIVALMTELLEITDGSKVLEVGTGSGYQAAVLAEIASEVYTVEIIPELAQRARETLDSLGYKNIYFLTADGYYGWQEHAPYDGIIVTCAPDHIPQPLLNQLAEGGRLVIPVGPPGFFQTLWQIKKTPEGVVSRDVCGVVFVPLTGKH